MLFRGFARASQPELIDLVSAVAATSPFRNLETRSGGTMSVAMTNCGGAGWISDRTGYRYDPLDPLTGRPWPAMPAAFLALATRAADAAGYARFGPDCCLVNRYRPGSALSLHRDRDEHDRHAPIVSVSLAAPAVFLWQAESADRPARIPLDPGDVVVFGGASRFCRHGVARLGRRAETRFNLTFRSTGRGARPAAAPAN